MIRVAADWLATIRALGESFLEVLRAELGAFTADLRASRAFAVRGAKIIVAGLMVAFWCVGVFVLSAVALLAERLGLWQAAALVATVLLLLALVLGLWARSTLRQVQAPTETARRHVQDHVDWIKGELKQTDGGDEETNESG